MAIAVDTRSAAQIFDEDGDFGPAQRVIDNYLAEIRTIELGRQPRCRRCDHLRRHHRSWPGACAFADCACPGPEPD